LVPAEHPVKIPLEYPDHGEALTQTEIGCWSAADLRPVVDPLEMVLYPEMVKESLEQELSLQDPFLAS